MFINARQSICLLVLRLVEAVGEAALPAVMAVKVARHEDAGAALVSRTLASQPMDFSVLVHLERKMFTSDYREPRL